MSADSQAQILSLTRTMLERAEAGDWEAVTAREAERRTLLESGGAKEGGEAFLRELLALNEKLVSSATIARDEAARATTTVQAGARAVSAYADNRR